MNLTKNMAVEITQSFSSHDGEPADAYGYCGGTVEELSASDVLVSLNGTGELVWLPVRRVKLARSH